MLRCSISSELEQVVLTAKCAFSKRSWPYVLATAIPWLLCAGQRAITRLAPLGGLKRSLSAYYRFLSDGKWRLPKLWGSLHSAIVESFQIRELTLVVDDTLCPKWGKSIFGTGSFFDHVRRPRAGYIWGHNWVVLAIVVRMGAGHSIALPFWIGLYRPKKDGATEAFQTRHQMVAGALLLVRALFSGPIRLLADGAYANDSLIGPARELKVEMVSRLRSDARLRWPNAARRRSTRGRKPTRGSWLPKLAAMARTRSAFREERVTIYGKSVRLLVREFEAFWPAIDCIVKVVITRDPTRPKRVAYLFTTDRSMTAVAVIEAFAQRWTIEQLFSVAKNQMGLDSAEVRKERSVVRHAALCMALITWTEIWAHRRRARLRDRSFAVKMAALRAETITETVFSSGPRTRGSRRIAQGVGTLFSNVTSAA